jgi:hypothetical protein
MIYNCRRFGTVSRVQQVSRINTPSLAPTASFEPSAYEDGTDRVFRNVSNYKSDAGESPKRRHTIF